LRALLAEADDVVAGQAHLFGAEPVNLSLAFDLPLLHWSDYETHPDLLSSFHFPHNDIKFIWEPARFGFAFTLGRAFHLTRDEKYSATFWRYFETFTSANPPYLGPNWMSGQEVALRLIAFAWAADVFSSARHGTPERMAALAAAIANHAARIPPTLIYARSQNNNHLLVEAAGLYTASLALPEHPRAEEWGKLGLKWLNWCFEHQFDDTGEYTQHSTNYHRLMLQLALWIHVIARRSPKVPDGGKTDEAISWGKSTDSSPAQQARNDAPETFLSKNATENIARATRWLLDLTDPQTGRAPNLGPNDGAYPIRLSSLPFADFRPALQCASTLFCGAPAFAPGPWDEAALWLGMAGGPHPQMSAPTRAEPVRGRLVHKDGWAYLRAARFASRPSHADQLHLDLWWHGLNIALDPGTYLYNAPPPWDNALTSALVHNTVTVDGLDQMTRAGKFLYLDWAQARILEQAPDRIVAEHDGYRRLGILHRRTLRAVEAGWHVSDELIASRSHARTYRLHWLLSDGNWRLEPGNGFIQIRFETQYGWISLKAGAGHSGERIRHSLARAGELLHGSGESMPIRGWASPTYGVKVPALSLAVEVESLQGVSFSSEFTLPIAG
jgi:hypothetical protein